MVENKEKDRIIYQGGFTDRKTEKFRQVDEGIKSLLDFGVSEKWVEPLETANHEKAHIAAHEPGRKSRIITRVLVGRRGIEGWSIEHDIDEDEKAVMPGKEIIKAALAPAFIRGRKVAPLSSIDIISAVRGGVLLGMDLMGVKRDE